jgi:hypothetical protein
VLVGRGPAPATFFVHSELICASSAFLKGALSHELIESKQRSVHLEEEEPEIVKLYLTWLYRGVLPTQAETNDDTEYLQLAQAYVLEDKLQVGDFRDAVTDAVVDKFK